MPRPCHVCQPWRKRFPSLKTPVTTRPEMRDGHPGISLGLVLLRWNGTSSQQPLLFRAAQHESGGRKASVHQNSHSRPGKGAHSSPREVRGGLIGSVGSVSAGASGVGGRSGPIPVSGGALIPGKRAPGLGPVFSLYSLQSPPPPPATAL